MVVNGFDLQGKSALLVGAASQVGRAIALTLADAGADMALTTSTGEDAEKRAVDACATEVAQKGVHSGSLEVDVTSDQDVRRMVVEAIAQLGRIDILVNNIDLAFAKPLVETTEEEWTTVVAANLTAVFHTTKYVAQHMLEHGKGKIVNITSQLGDRGLANASAYCAAKGGVVLFTKAAGLEWARQGISINGIGLGWFEGDPLAQEGDEELKDRLMRYLPMHRLGRPDEVGVLAVYLASDASDSITGHTIFMEGGAMSHV